MNRIVVYSAVFGGKDELIDPEVKSEGVSFVCITDRNLRSETWDVRRVAPVHRDPVRAAKIYKILPHRYFPDYEYSVWVDGNILVRGDMSQLIEQYLSSANIAFFDHRNTRGDARGSVYEEADALLEMERKGKPKDDSSLIQKQMTRYRREGYSGDNGLIVGMEIVRRHNEPDVVQSMEDWWREIEHGSRRDQLSFNYVAWKNGLNFTFMDGDSRDNHWFLWRPHAK